MSRKSKVKKDFIELMTNASLKDAKRAHAKAHDDNRSLYDFIGMKGSEDG